MLWGGGWCRLCDGSLVEGSVNFLDTIHPNGDYSCP